MLSKETAPFALSATVQIILTPPPNAAKYLPPRLVESVVSSRSVSDSSVTRYVKRASRGSRSRREVRFEKFATSFNAGARTNGGPVISVRKARICPSGSNT